MASLISENWVSQSTIVRSELELLGAVLREVCLTRRHAPFITAFIRLKLAHQNPEQRRLRQLIGADESDLVIVAEGKGNTVQDLDAVDRLGRFSTSSTSFPISRFGRKSM